MRLARPSRMAFSFSPPPGFPATPLVPPTSPLYVATVTIPSDVARNAWPVALSITVSILVGVPAGLAIALLVALIA